MNQREFFGGETPEVPVVSRDRPARNTNFWRALIGVAPVKVLGANRRRMALLILNTGAAVLSIDDRAPVAATSFPIPGGAALTLNNYTGELWIVATAPVTVGFIEMEL